MKATGKYADPNRHYSNNVFANIENVWPGGILDKPGPLSVRRIKTTPTRSNGFPSGMYLFGFVDPNNPNKILGPKTKEPHVSVPLRQKNSKAMHITRYGKERKHYQFLQGQYVNVLGPKGKKVKKYEALKNGEPLKAAGPNRTGLMDIKTVLNSRQNALNVAEIEEELRRQNANANEHLFFS